MRRTIHFCQSVSGALRNWSKKDWDMNGAENNMSGAALKERFRIMEFEGKKVIPIGEPCEGFSYTDGCPGHEVKESDATQEEKVG